MNIRYFFTCVLCFAATATWANETDKNETDKNKAPAEIEGAKLASNPIKIKTRSEIHGLWGMRIPENTSCVEYYNFKGSNNLVVKSGEEWSTGIYDYQAPQDPMVQMPALIMQIKYDNNQLDCSGHQVDQTGEISQYYVQWRSPTVINFCNNDKAEECFATLYRVLP